MREAAWGLVFAREERGPGFIILYVTLMDA